MCRFSFGPAPHGGLGRMKSYNPLDERQLQALVDAVDYSRWRLQPFREKRFEAVRQYVGMNYSDDGTDLAVPISLIELAVNIYTRQLAANTPRSLVTTKHVHLKPQAAELGLASDHLFEEIDFGETLRMAVIEALFSMGIIKTGLSVSDQLEFEGYTHDIGQPYADVVGLDDWVQDMNAERKDQWQFCGNMYTLPYEFIKESPLYTKEGRDSLTISDEDSYNEQGDERAGTLSRGTQTNRNSMYPPTRLIDLWLPIDNLLVTLPYEIRGQQSSSFGEPLRIVDFDGPEGGPYDILSFSPVPGNVLPLPPAALWKDLHDLANQLFRKLGRQADRQKDVLVVQGSATEDGKRIVQASDGEAVRSDNPGATQQVKFGGADPNSNAFLIQVLQHFKSFAGNLDLLGGLSPQSETLGQDRLLANSASKRVSDMQDQVAKFTKKVSKKLAWYLWNDPLIDIPLVKPIEGTDLSIQTRFTAEDKEGDFLDYNFSITPYSMQDRSPAERLQTITQVFGQFIVPFMSMLEKEGISINFAGLLRVIAKYTDMDELEDFLVFNGAPDEGERPVGQASGKAANTTRTYQRINRPGTTQQGQDEALSAMLKGIGQQPAQQAAAVRGVG